MNTDLSLLWLSSSSYYYLSKTIQDAFAFKTLLPSSTPPPPQRADSFFNVPSCSRSDFLLEASLPLKSFIAFISRLTQSSHEVPLSKVPLISPAMSKNFLLLARRWRSSCSIFVYEQSQQSIHGFSYPST